MKLYKKIIIILIVMIITISAPIGSYYIGQQNAYAWNNFEFKEKIWAGMAWAIAQTGIFVGQRDMQTIINDHHEEIEEVIMGMPEAARTIGYFISDRVDTIGEQEVNSYLQDLKAGIPELADTEISQLEASFYQAQDILADGIVTVRELIISGLPMTNMMDRYLNTNNTGLYNTPQSIISYDGDIYNLILDEYRVRYLIHYNMTKNNNFMRILSTYGESFVKNIFVTGNVSRSEGFQKNIYIIDGLGNRFHFQITHRVKFHKEYHPNLYYNLAYNFSSFQIKKYQFNGSSWDYDTYEDFLTVPTMEDLIDYISLNTSFEKTDFNSDYLSLPYYEYLNMDMGVEYSIPSANIGIYNPTVNPDYDRDTNPQPFVIPDINIDIPDNNISVEWNPATEEWNISAITDSLGQIQTGIEEGNDLTGETNTILGRIENILEGIRSNTDTSTGEVSSTIDADIQGLLNQKLNITALQSSFERLQNIPTTKGTPPVIYINLYSLLNAGTSRISPGIQNPFQNKDYVFIDFGYLDSQQITFMGQTIIDYFRFIIGMGMLFTTGMYIWKKIIPEKVVS